MTNINAKYKNVPLIDDQHIKCELNNIGISELGYIMIDLYYYHDKKIVSHCLGKWNEEKNFISEIIF